MPVAVSVEAAVVVNEQLQGQSAAIRSDAAVAGQWSTHPLQVPEFLAEATNELALRSRSTEGIDTLFVRARSLLPKRVRLLAVPVVEVKKHSIKTLLKNIREIHSFSWL